MKLYPPHIEGTLSSFYKTQEKGMVLTVPFSMNRAVSPAEVFGYALRVKEVINNEELFTVTTTNHSSTSEALFTIGQSDANKFIVGSYYKFQLAYLDADLNAGYFSTVGVTKCTTLPTVTIDGLSLTTNNTHKYQYTGYYNNIGDPTEKVYYYQFILSDNDGNIISDSGKQIHLNEDNASNTYESIDNFSFLSDLEKDESYLLQYIITTNNNLVVKSPKYRVIQPSLLPMTENIKLETSLNFDEGYIKISAVYNEDADAIYTLDNTEEYSSVIDYYEKKYRVVDLDKENYKPQYFYYLLNGEYIQDTYDVFDIAKVYYESYYERIKITESSYVPYKYFLRQDHFVRGNFLISRSCKDTDYKEWEQLAIIKINGYGNEFFTKNDFTIEQGKYYKYSIQQYNNYGTLSERVITDEIFSDFEDLFLYDGERQLKVKYNPKVSSFKIDKLMAKTDTIGGKYPYIFQNSITYYHEFPIAGLISYKMDENELFIPVEELGLDPSYDSMHRTITFETNELKNRIITNIYKINENAIELAELEERDYITNAQRARIDQLKEDNHILYQENNTFKEVLTKKVSEQRIFARKEYKTTNLESVNIAAERIFKTEVLDWLNDGKPKLFRSPGEGNFIIVLLNVSLSPEDALSRMLHSFSATAYEIADFNYQNLLSYGLQQRDTLDYNFLLWKTINFSERKGIDNYNGNFFLDENFQQVVIYRGDVQYNCYELLNGNIVYSLYFEGMMPGSIIFVDGQEYVIGTTGNYYMESSTGFSSVMIPQNQSYTGSFVYSYYGETLTSFDLIISENISSESGAQLIGTGVDILTNLNGKTSVVKDWGFLQLKGRDIVEVQLAEEANWDNTYYLDNTCEVEVLFVDETVDTKADIYYYLDEEAYDLRYIASEYGESLEDGRIYYKNNRFHINPLYVVNPEIEEESDEEDVILEEEEEEREFYCVYREGLYTLDGTEKIITKRNNLPLYKYSTDKFIYNNTIEQILDMEENPTAITVYRDFLYDKYYLDSEEMNNDNIDYDNLLNNYNFEILDFNIIIDGEIYAVGPLVKHKKVGKLFTKYQLLDINNEEDFNNAIDTYRELYDSEQNEVVEYIEGETYYFLQNYTTQEFYATKDCETRVFGITEDNCENFYVFDHIKSEIDYTKEHAKVLKGLYHFDSIILGNGTFLNAAYRAYNKTYAIEDLDRIDRQYYDGKLASLKERMEYYQSVLNDTDQSDTGLVHVSLVDLESIVNYYKDSLLEQITEMNQGENFVESHLLIEKYADFLTTYNSYLAGNITTLTEFQTALGDNGELLRTIEALIKEKVIVKDNAREQYLKYSQLYKERVEQLLTIYDEEE